MAEHMKSKRTIGTSKSKNVTFAEFIQHLTDPDTFEASSNPHWERYSELRFAVFFVCRVYFTSWHISHYIVFIRICITNSKKHPFPICTNFFLKMAEHMKSKRTIGTSKSKNVTFAEFIQHLTDPDTFETSNNPHWERYSELSY
jgi:hypothetical protein